MSPAGILLALFEGHSICSAETLARYHSFLFTNWCTSELS